MIRLPVIFFEFLDCMPGYYGYGCEKACSRNCLNNSICDNIDGTCRGGCQHGYIGKLCNECKTYRYPFLYPTRIWERLCFIHVPRFYILQRAKRVLLDKIVLVFAHQTARNVNLQTAHVAAMLAGWDLTVQLVFVKTSQYISSFNMNMWHNKVP